MGLILTGVRRPPDVVEPQSKSAQARDKACPVAHKRSCPIVVVEIRWTDWGAVPPNCQLFLDSCLVPRTPERRCPSRHVQ
jgi:hypothetical protein